MSSENISSILFINLSKSFLLTEFLSNRNLIIPLLARYAISNPSGLNLSISAASEDSA